jgi:dedicated sortase system histidine kinase
VTLRRQLLLVSLLLLSLPWAGCQFVREMEGALRHGQEQSLQATAQAVAAILGQREELLYPDPERRLTPVDERPLLYAHPLDAPLIVDGYGDGWEDIPAARLQSETSSAPFAVSYRAATRKGVLYLLLQVQDEQVIFHNPGLSAEPNGDRLVLRTWRDGRRQEYVLATSAPGRIRAAAASPLPANLDPGAIQGFWQDAAGGYNLELAIPLSYTGERLGFYLVNAGRGDPFETLGNTGPLDTAAPPWLIYSPDDLQKTLAPFGAHSNHIQVIDRDNWLIADIPAHGDSRGDMAETFWLLRQLYRSILSVGDDMQLPPAAASPGKVAGEELDKALQGMASSQRYRDAVHSDRTVLAAAAPITVDGRVAGAVVVRQSGEQYLSLTDQAFSRLLGYSLMALCAGAFGLLAYASWLSWRIGRLSRAARQALEEEGPLAAAFPRSDAGDEIGELSRHYADLLERLREYNNYLRTLSRKLSHELRTPIAVIQTSLENLEQAGDKPADNRVYVSRAREGLLRLNSILTAMSEANRLEESIRSNSPHQIDLVPLLQEVFEAYRGIYPQHELTLELEADAATANAVPELIVQALDKLMDNAASFCPPGGRITLRLAAGTKQWELSVSNQGPPLPDVLQEGLFDPMVSMRGNTSAGVHLGLGLHIVRLIVDFHHARVKAENLPDNDGVRVSIYLPVS